MTEPHESPPPPTCGRRAAASDPVCLGKGGLVLRDSDPPPCTRSATLGQRLEPTHTGPGGRNPLHRNSPVAADDRRIIDDGLTPASKPSPRRNAPRGRMMMPSLRRAGGYRSRRFSDSWACMCRASKEAMPADWRNRSPSTQRKRWGRATVPGMAAEQTLLSAPTWQSPLVGPKAAQKLPAPP
jgi:hypothetical protein